MNKKAQGLSMNTVIIAILVLVVLVFIIIFFTGGFGNIATKIKETLMGVPAGQDLTIARENCRNYCEQAQAVKDDQSLVKRSAYCTSYFKLDLEQPQGADKYKGDDLRFKDAYIRYHCSDNHAVDSTFEDLEKGDLNIGCPGISCY